MSLPASIFSKLSDPASRTAQFVETGAACRVYPEFAPAGTVLPYIVFSEISSDPAGTHDASSDFDGADIQFSIIAPTYKAARAIRRAIRLDLSDTVLAGGESAVRFIERGGFSDSIDAHVLTLDVSFWHNPTAE